MDDKNNNQANKLVIFQSEKSAEYGMKMNGIILWWIL